MIREDLLKAQFDRADKLGWIPSLLSLPLHSNITPALILALCSRETNLDPRYLRTPGDGGHGFGLCQADIRSFPEWINSGKWRDAVECFVFANGLLGEELEMYLREPSLPGEFLVTSRGGQHYSVARRAFPDIETALAVTISSYNCGRWAYYHYCKGRDIDFGTTPGPTGGPDYSRDVLERAGYFQRLLDSREHGSVHPIQSGLLVNPVAVGTASATVPPVRPIPPMKTDAFKSETNPEPKEEGFVVSIADKVKEAQGQYETIEKAIPDILKRPGSIKSFRLWLGNLVGGGGLGLAGLFTANKTFIYIGIGVALLICFLYFARQWHLDALWEKNNRPK